jgi:clan AA aspartic protease
VISGIVSDGQATVTIAFRFADRSDLSIEFVVDTGFTDYLCLHPEAVALLGLPFKYAMPVNLADNSEVILPVHEAVILWNGERSALRSVRLSAHAEVSASLSRPVITRVDDPDFDDKIQTAIRQQIAEHRS